MVAPDDFQPFKNSEGYEEEFEQTLEERKEKISVIS